MPETIDPVGIETLLRMADVEAYNDWVYRQIRPYMGERVLDGTIGRAMGSYRRYERRPLRGRLVRSGFEVESLRYMTLPGILGWFMNGRVFRRDLLPRPQLALFNVLAPLFERVEASIP